MQTDATAGAPAVEVVPGVFLRQLSVGDRMSVQHVLIEPGAAVPEHDHPHEQLGYLVAGGLTFEVAEEEVVVEAGESYTIPGDEPHAVRNDGDRPARAIDVFSPPRANPDWAEHAIRGER